ncbi:MAG: hypothetical protein JNN22_01995 [Rhodospirillales bacterium]|nr:hypothetical protein [Rhodospirillales bacterium]
MKFPVLAIAAALLLAACAGPTPRAVIVDGSIKILDRGVPGIQPGAASGEWMVVRGNSDGQLNVMNLQGAIVVRPDSPGGAWMGRRVATTVGATPFLRWSWYLEPQQFAGGPGDGTERGVRIVIFFRSVERPSIERYAGWVGVPGPEWDRFVEFDFGGFGAPRIEEARLAKWVSDDAGRKLMLREPRAGQAGLWHSEAVDLNEVHKHFWPNEDPAKVQVVMVAVGGLRAAIPAEASPAIGYLADVSLSK